MVDLRVSGVSRYGDLAKDLRAVANKGLRKEMNRGLRKAATPLAREEAPRAARERLPKAGGLNEYVASSKFGIRSKVSSRGVGVRIVGLKRGHDIKALDKGVARHPVFARGGGSENVWVNQAIEPGWWTEGLSDSTVLAPMRLELLAVLDNTVRRIARGG